MYLVHAYNFRLTDIRVMLFPPYLDNIAGDERKPRQTRIEYG